MSHTCGMFRPRVSEVLAVHWLGHNFDEVAQAILHADNIVVGCWGNTVYVPTATGALTAKPGDWIVFGPTREWVVYSHLVFHKYFIDEDNMTPLG